VSVTIKEIRDHVFGVASWVDRERTCDRITYGEESREVRKVGTGWVPCVPNLKAAADDGCDLFISHEVPFYGNWATELDSTRDTMGARPHGRAHRSRHGVHQPARHLG